MAAEPLRPVYLLMGTDRPKVGRALARLRARFSEGAAETLSAEESSGADVVAECNALGLLGDGGGRLVVVGHVERWNKDDLEPVIAYLNDPTAGTVLALVAGEPLRTERLVKACEEVGQVLVFDVPKPRDPSAWVRSEFVRLGIAADEDAARALVDRVGPDVTVLAGEIDKLTAWAGNDPVGRRDVEALAVPGHEDTAWALTDAWGNRDLGVVLRTCETELELGVEPFVIAARLAGHVGLVRSAQLLAAEGLPVRDVAKRLRKHEFRIRKALGHAENYSVEELDDAVIRLANLDASLKGASRLAAELELERALVELTSPAGSPRRS